MADTDYEKLFDADLVDVEGRKVGSIGQVYLDDQTGQPTWVTVKTGWFGLKETFVPLENAVVGGGRVEVGFTEQMIKDAPRVDPDKHLDANEEAQLYAYYGIAVIMDDQSAPPVESAAVAPVAEQQFADHPGHAESVNTEQFADEQFAAEPFATESFTTEPGEAPEQSEAVWQAAMQPVDDPSAVEQVEDEQAAFGDSAPYADPADSVHSFANTAPKGPIAPESMVLLELNESDEEDA